MFPESFHLPVHKNKSGADLDLAFTSQICNDHFCSPIAAIYCRQSEYVALEFPFIVKVPSEKIADTWRLFNLINEMMPLYHYSIWKSNNGFSLIGGLILVEINYPPANIRALSMTFLKIHISVFH